MIRQPPRKDSDKYDLIYYDKIEKILILLLKKNEVLQITKNEEWGINIKKKK